MNLTPEDATAEPATPVAPDATATPVLLDHERLDAFQVALEFAAMVPALTKTDPPRDFAAALQRLRGAGARR